MKQYYIMVSVGIYGDVTMAKNTSITLGDHFETFISSQLESGRYGSASEIVRAGLRLLEDSESKLQALRQMLIQGEESGIADYNYKDFLIELDEHKH
jgi:antitoxin ParD1/3/4